MELRGTSHFSSLWCSHSRHLVDSAPDISHEGQQDSIVLLENEREDCHLTGYQGHDSGQSVLTENNQLPTEACTSRLKLNTVQCDFEDAHHTWRSSISLYCCSMIFPYGILQATRSRPSQNLEYSHDTLKFTNSFLRQKIRLDGKMRPGQAGSSDGPISLDNDRVFRNVEYRQKAAATEEMW